MFFTLHDMTLNKPKTHLLDALLCDEKALFGLSIISNADYNDLCDEVGVWEQAYLAGNLYGTMEDNTTFKYEGIGDFPKPPKR